MKCKALYCKKHSTTFFVENYSDKEKYNCTEGILKNEKCDITGEYNK